MELFDISVPEKLRSISFFDCSGPTSRGVHQLWFCDGEFVPPRACDSRRRIRMTISSIMHDVRNPSKPPFSLPVDAGTRQGDNVPPPRHALDKATARTTPTSIRKRTAATSLYRRRHVHLFRQGEPEVSEWTNSPPYTLHARWRCSNAG
jgi:hypothetical protein